MKLFEWRKNVWYRQVLFALTIVVVVLLAAHPELRLLLPLVDALGLDLLLLLISAQFLAYSRPLLHEVHRVVISPSASRLYSLVIYLLGIAGPYVEARVTVYRLSLATVG